MTGIVSIWRKRFAAAGIDGLKDKPRPGAKRVYGDATDKRILAMLDQPVPKGRARWDAKLLAKELDDVDVNYVRRFLRKHKIDLSGRKSWCESKDPEFAAKAADVVGLYMSPPANAIVLCIDEKPSNSGHRRSPSESLRHRITCRTSTQTQPKPVNPSAAPWAGCARAGPPAGLCLSSLGRRIRGCSIGTVEGFQPCLRAADWW